MLEPAGSGRPGSRPFWKCSDEACERVSMKVLLLQPRPDTGPGFRGTIQTEPLGLEVVAATLGGRKFAFSICFGNGNGNGRQGI